MRGMTVCCLSLVGWIGLASVVCGQSARRDRWEDKRRHMVSEYIEAEGVRNPRVLHAMRTVPRHEFVTSLYRGQAYNDGALPIGDKQTISPPYIVAYMTATLDPQKGDKVLEIGTGSGYQAAVLAELVEEVYTIEIVERLGQTAARRLKRLGYDNVRVKVGDGYQGWPQYGPFDRIIVTCSPESVPQPLVDQLREGGRMIIPLGERYQQVFYLFEKQNGELIRKKLIPTLFVPMTGISEERREVKPDPLNPKIVNGGFEADDNDDDRADNWHYQRRTKVITTDAPEGERYLLFENDEIGRISQMLQGMALDGRAISHVRLSAQVKFVDTEPGARSWQRPAIVMHFYDQDRKPLGEGFLGPWIGTDVEWRRRSATLRIPPGTREAIVRIGLNGATGSLSVDDVQLERVDR